jgi:hypothetical protein
MTLVFLQVLFPIPLSGPMREFARKIQICILQLLVILRQRSVPDETLLDLFNLDIFQFAFINYYYTT